MPNRNLIGRCGTYCGYCEIYRAYKDSDRLRMELAKRYECQLGDIVCEGCQMLHAKGWAKDGEWGRNCKIRECLGDRGFKYCYECPEVNSCERLGDLEDTYVHLGVDLKANLRMLKLGQVTEWLEQQDRRYRCGHCNCPIILSSDMLRCHRCGQIPDE